MTMVLSTALMTLALLQGGAAPRPQPLDATLERDAYAIFATLLEPPWQEMNAQGQGPMLLQRETERPTGAGCQAFLAGLTGEWAEIRDSFERENRRVRLLQHAVPVEVQYRLIARAAIAADDARLVKKHGGGWQRTPGSLEYAAVSVVGFNAARTRALVYVRMRMSGNVFRMELRDGQWARFPGTACGWVA